MIKIYDKNANLNKALIYATLANFLIIIVWIVIFKVNRAWVPEMKEYFSRLPISSRVGKNYIPGYSIITSVKNSGFSLSSDHFLNVLAFIPYGIIFPYIFKRKKYLYSVLVIVGSTVFFETFQLLSCIGAFDASDFLTNTLGGIIGLILYKTVFSKLRDNVINVISSSICLIATPVSLYAVFNTIRCIHYYI